jgi:large subunit ribosomal protein L18
MGNVKKVKKNSLVKGTANRPRLSVFRSNSNIFAQIVDDTTGQTLVSASSLKEKNGGNLKAADNVGKHLAESAKTKKISKVVFDRGRYVYRGRLKALADAARKAGLDF